MHMINPGILEAIHTYDILNTLMPIVVFLFTYFKTFINENIPCPTQPIVVFLFTYFKTFIKGNISCPMQRRRQHFMACAHALCSMG